MYFCSHFHSQSVIEATESDTRLRLVEEMIDKHVLTDACLEHLAQFVAQPSERLGLYETQNWSQLSRTATAGILENSREVQYNVLYKKQ